MKSNNLLIAKFLLLLTTLFLSFGCYTVSREVKLLGNSKITGTMNYPPVFLTHDQHFGGVVIAPSFSTNAGKELRKITDGAPGPYTYSSNNNLIWDASGVNAGLNFDLPLSEQFSLTGSISYVKGNGPIGSAGISSIFKDENAGVRIDAGLLFSKFTYDVHSSVKETISYLFGGRETNIYYYHDTDIGSSTNFYFSLTINTINDERLINYFLNLSYFTQKVFDYIPGNYDKTFYLDEAIFEIFTKSGSDSNFEYTAKLINIYPGLYFNLSKHARLLAGSRILFESEMSSFGKNITFAPSIQFEYSF